jgi:2-methylisocitrate lyase-like PEP mutase family enzyme
MVSRTVANYARAGVAALHIEDQVSVMPCSVNNDEKIADKMQVQEKRCGFLKGKQVVERGAWYSRLRAAINAREKMQSDIVIIGQTDSRQQFGFDEAIKRLKEAKRIGVDVVILKAIQTKEECKKTCEIMGDTPVLFNMVPGPGSPDLTVEEAKALGFRLIISPGVCSSKVLASFKEPRVTEVYWQRGDIWLRGCTGAFYDDRLRRSYGD